MKKWEEMTDREKCEAMAAWVPGTYMPCWDAQCCAGCIMYYPVDGDCGEIAARLLKEGKV